MHQQRLPKPPWLKIKASNYTDYAQTRAILDEFNCTTICEEAACPNARECWSKSHAAFMILGDVCTRRCPFCNVQKGSPRGKVDITEPMRLASAVAKMKLKHVVITSVTRDDLQDGGADQFAKCIEKIREQDAEVVIEVLTPDFFAKDGALEGVLAARPDVFNHNLEVVPRLYRKIRPGANYKRSLELLARAKKLIPSLFTKSGLMLGLGEEKDEVLQVMDDMRSYDIDFLVLGQYLQPSNSHAEVVRYVHPDEFAEFEAKAKEKGFSMVSASPFARSSFHADTDFAALRQARERGLATMHS
jgi:lipoic acid synthetase